MRRTLILIAALAMAPLAACGESAPADAAPPGSEPQPDPPPGPVGPPVAAHASLPFAGAWASSAENCKSQAWQVRADGLETPGETSCSWNPADVKAAGPDAYTVAGACSAENPAQPATLTFRGDGQNLTIEGAPFEAIPLVRCTGAEG